MRLEQLNFLCAVVDHGFSITRAAEALHISQPAVSKQISNLEIELGADLLIRSSGRVVGLTAAGYTTLAKARQVLMDIDELVRSGRGLTDATSGRLVIATTHTHARYALLQIIKDFRLSYPHVHLHLVQANPSQVIEAIVAGTADIGISSVQGQEGAGLRIFHGCDLTRSIIAPVGHPIFRNRVLTLQHVSTYALLTLDFSFPGGRAVEQAFETAGLEPNIVMTATDSDVLKAYVRMGLGVAVLPTITFDPIADQPLQAMDATHLFGSAPSVILVRREKRIAGYLADFIDRIAPGQVEKS